MSFVFAILLGAYAVLRWLLWARGQWRLHLGAKVLPQIPERCETPHQIRPELARFFESCAQTHRQLCIQRRRIAKARLCDPDQQFGFLRDARYRRAVIEAQGIVRRWCSSNEVFFGLRRRRHRNWPVGPECAQATLQAIAHQVQLAQHSRALEPFALKDVQSLDEALASFATKLEQTLTDLRRANVVSYRCSSLGSHDLASHSA